MTSGNTFPRRFTKIDELTRSDHSYLTAEDTCYFLGEYSARKGYAFSPTNDLIINFKKPPTVRHTNQWRHKERAISVAATAFRAALDGDALNQITFVPVPPSKSKTDPLYDNRIVQMLTEIRPAPPLDIRELLLQPISTTAAHDGNRPRPEELVRRYTLDKTLLKPPPNIIAIVDDVLTTGAHFKAAQTVLRSAFPQARILGLFIARRVPEAIDFEDFKAL